MTLNKLENMLHPVGWFNWKFTDCFSDLFACWTQKPLENPQHNFHFLTYTLGRGFLLLCHITSSSPDASCQCRRKHPSSLDNDGSDVRIPHPSHTVTLTHNLNTRDPYGDVNLP